MRISDWSSDVCSSDLFGDEERVPVTKVFKVERAGRHAGLERLPLDRHNPGPCHLGSTVYSLLEEAHLVGVAGLLPGIQLGNDARKQPGEFPGVQIGRAHV